jgi:2-dehydro-3-deoxygluconokinase
MQFDLVCIGEAMALFAPMESRTLEVGSLCRVDAAGAEANVARNLALLGGNVAWISAVGADLLGALVIDAVGGDGVDVSMVTRDSENPTGAIFKSQGAGERGVQYLRKGSAASYMGPSTIEQLARIDSKFFHITGVTAALSESCLDLVQRLVMLPVPRPRISFDVNYRTLLWEKDPSQILWDIASKADVVFVGLDEAQELWGISAPEEIRELVGNDSEIVVKNSGLDAHAFLGSEHWMLPAPKKTVVEAVGAGDAFAAGYILGDLLGLSALERLELGHEVAGVVLGIPLDTPSAEDLAHLPKVERK